MRMGTRAAAWQEPQRARGRRPADAAFANVVSLVPDAEAKSHSVNVGWNLTLLEWKRAFFFANYTWSKSDTNTTGASRAGQRR